MQDSLLRLQESRFSDWWHWPPWCPPLPPISYSWCLQGVEGQTPAWKKDFCLPSAPRWAWKPSAGHFRFLNLAMKTMRVWTGLCQPVLRQPHALGTEPSLIEEVIGSYSGSPFPVITARQMDFKLHPKRLTGHLSLQVMTQKYSATAVPTLQRGRCRVQKAKHSRDCSQKEKKNWLLFWSKTGPWNRG